MALFGLEGRSLSAKRPSGGAVDLNDSSVYRSRSYSLCCPRPRQRVPNLDAREIGGPDESSACERSWHNPRNGVSRHSHAGSVSVSDVGEIEWDLGSDRWQWDSDVYDVFGAVATRVRANGASLIALKHPDDGAMCKEVIHDIQNGLQRFSYSPRIFAENGMVREITAFGTVYVGPRGSPGTLH